MSTHVSGFQSFFRFLHHFVLAKLATMLEYQYLHIAAHFLLAAGRLGSCPTDHSGAVRHR